jgi:hypothetical protein
MIDIYHETLCSVIIFKWFEWPYCIHIRYIFTLRSILASLNGSYLPSNCSLIYLSSHLLFPKFTKYIQCMFRSMLTSVVSAMCLLVVMLALGPLFQPLPVCVLAAIIIASLVNIMMKVWWPF